MESQILQYILATIQKPWKVNSVHPCMLSSSMIPVCDRTSHHCLTLVSHIDASNHVEEEHDVRQSTLCVLCEFAMMQLDQYLEDNATEVCVCRISAYSLFKVLN